jgi:hypothetical protein
VRQVNLPQGFGQLGQVLENMAKSLMSRFIFDKDFLA